MSGPRNPALDSAFLLLDILARIPRRRFTTTSHIFEQLQAAGYQVTRRTVQRHLDALCERFPLECDTRTKPYGYRWLEGAHGFCLPRLSPPEALLLQLAKSQLTELLPNRTLTTLAPLFSSARLQLDDKSSPQADRRWLKKIARIPDGQPLLAARIAPGVFEAVGDALYQERQLLIRYRNAHGAYKQASVQPLALVQQEVRLYLVCRFEGYDNERILALPRIQEVQIGASFAYPKDFNLSAYLEAGHFGIRRGLPVKLSFCIEKTVGLHLVESPLSADQQVVEEGNWLRITATVTETELLHRWLRGWGEELTELVITPCGEAIA